MAGEWPLIGAVVVGWCLLGAAFIAGMAWRGWTHRCCCQTADVHALDRAYSLGIADERARREDEIRQLDAWNAT